MGPLSGAGAEVEAEAEAEATTVVGGVSDSGICLLQIYERFRKTDPRTALNQRHSSSLAQTR